MGTLFRGTVGRVSCPFRVSAGREVRPRRVQSTTRVSRRGLSSPRSGTDFATIWGTFCDAIFCASLSHSCAFCAHFLRILCIFGALGQMQWMHRPADRASRPGVAKYRNAAFVVHFTCIYVHLRTRMQNACRMHVNVHKMALAKLQVHSPDAILPRSSPDHPSPASECHPDRHRGRWLRMHMNALRMHRRECKCSRWL